MQSSTCSTKSPYSLAALRPWNSLVGTQGVWVVEAIAACERAIALQDDTTDAIDRGRVRVTLARALHGAGREATRVSATLQEARAALRATGVNGIADLAALEAWAAELAGAPTMAVR